MVEAEEHLRPAIFLIKEIEKSETVARIVVFFFVCNGFTGFQIFLKICGFHLLEEFIILGNVV